MHRRYLPMLALAFILVISFAFAVPAFAQSQALGVALSPVSSCTLGALDLTMNTDATVNREGGIATTGDGTVILSFDQPTTLSSFSGTFNGYSFPIPPQPSGTIIGLYAYVGSLPYNASTTIEWFLAYRCDTREVIYTCFGPYGSCPQNASQIPQEGVCPNPLPANFVVRSIPAGALAYFAPNTDSYTGFNLPPGTWYTGALQNGFYKVWLTCGGNMVYVPEANVID